MSELYRYTGCGLDYIYLSNGYEIKDTPFGKGVTINDLDGLHRIILSDLMENRPSWTGDELRFIRKELGMTQKTLGMFVSRDAQTVALWEKDKKPVPAEASNIIRGIYTSREHGSVKFEDLLNRINDLDRELNHLKKKLAYKSDATGWHATTTKAA
ncbi:MAG TPA: transcriptional regulator [Gammaproteobacteria bacterium]